MNKRLMFDDALRRIILHEQKGLKMKSFQAFDIEDKVYTQLWRGNNAQSSQVSCQELPQEVQ